MTWADDEASLSLLVVHSAAKAAFSMHRYFVFVTSTNGRLKLFLLPAYSPELNPDEWVWKNVKHDRAGKTTVASSPNEGRPRRRSRS
jgi:transposase